MMVQSKNQTLTELPTLSSRVITLIDSLSDYSAPESGLIKNDFLVSFGAIDIRLSGAGSFYAVFDLLYTCDASGIRIIRSVRSRIWPATQVDNLKRQLQLTYPKAPKYIRTYAHQPTNLKTFPNP